MDNLLEIWLSGVFLACAAAPIGTVLLWRRMAFFGDATAHAAMLGGAIGLALHFSPILAVLLFATLGSVVIFSFEYRTRMTGDSMLGLYAHGMMGLGLLVLGVADDHHHEALLGFLMGDIAKANWMQVIMIGLWASIVWASCMAQKHSLVLGSLNPALASAEGYRIHRNSILFGLLAAVTVAASMHLAGLLLASAMLIIPAAAARLLAASPIGMMIMAAMVGALAVTLAIASHIGMGLAIAPATVSVGMVIFMLLALVKLTRE